MGGMGCVLPHPTSEQVGLITLPFPLPVQQVSQGAPWESADACPGQPTQRRAYDASLGLFTLATKS